MKIFVAGATGAVGRSLLPLLARHGHEVTGMTRSQSKAELVRELGARPVIADALDRDAVAAAVLESRPEVVVHQLTALSEMGAPRNMDKTFALTNRLRTEGTDNLLAAARAAGARRFVAQSYAGWPYAREGGPVKTEDDPLDPTPPKQARQTLEAIRRLESTVTGAEGIEGIVLRYGGFYGPGTGMSKGGEQVELVAKRRFPIVGDGGGIWSLVHIEDVAEATLAAIEHGRPGAIYNIVDDDPAPVRELVRALADAVGAKPPRKVPVWLGRLAAGEAGVSMMTQVRGASNEKARRELGWTPKHPSWRESLPAALG
jgi:nucleoside-diphosphate-sugar epimerase